MHTVCLMYAQCILGLSFIPKTAFSKTYQYQSFMDASCLSDMKLDAFGYFFHPNSDQDSTWKWLCLQKYRAALARYFQVLESDMRIVDFCEICINLLYLWCLVPNIWWVMCSWMHMDCPDSAWKWLLYMKYRKALATFRFWSLPWMEWTAFSKTYQYQSIMDASWLSDV